MNRGPGFKEHVLEALQRIDRNLDLAWCNFRKHWLVVRTSGPAKRSWWNGTWHRGYEVEVRWRGVGGVYRAAFPHEEHSFLPLDQRLVRLVRACDIARRREASERWDEAEEVDMRRWRTRQQRRADRKEESESFYRTRHDLERNYSIGGFQPGQVNDYETESEALGKMSARARAAMNRVRVRVNDDTIYGENMRALEVDARKAREEALGG